MYAHAESSGDVTFKGGDNVVFKQVVANLGNAFNTELGIFKAPVDGLYFFSVSLCTGTPMAYTYFYLVHDEVNLARGLVGDAAWGDCDSISAAAYMQKDSEAWVLYENNSKDGNEITMTGNEYFFTAMLVNANVNIDFLST